MNGFGHCAECHSPRNALGGIIRGERFAGGPNPEGEGWVPNITQKGIGGWSEKDIADFLETGDMPEGDSASGSMRPVIKNLAQLTPEDRAAMAAYLKSLPPVDGPTPPNARRAAGSFQLTRGLRQLRLLAGAKRLERDDGKRVLDAGQHLHLLVDEVADVGVLIDIELHQQIVMAGRGVDSEAISASASALATV